MCDVTMVTYLFIVPEIKEKIKIKIKQNKIKSKKIDKRKRKCHKLHLACISITSGLIFTN